jgi:hypothetical protein
MRSRLAREFIPPLERQTLVAGKRQGGDLDEHGNHHNEGDGGANR